MRSADVTALDEVGSTPLHLASRNEDVGVVRMLIEHGVDVTVMNMFGSTRLHWGSRRGHPEIACLLLERKCGGHSHCMCEVIFSALYGMIMSRKYTIFRSMQM
jgi:ankyrin repeat protein